jgi:hypothetical protein
MDLSALLPGVATVLLALFGGAGGSLLVELWWNPRRARRRVAALLAEEVNLNAQLLTLHVHLRRTNPGQISADFQVMQLAFEAVAQEIAELPANVAGQVILTYHYFDRLNRLREMVRERLSRWREAQESGRGDLYALEHNAMSGLEYFNGLVDRTLAATEQTLALLRAHAPKRKQRFVSDAEYAERVATSKRLEQDVQ